MSGGWEVKGGPGRQEPAQGMGLCCPKQNMGCCVSGLPPAEALTELGKTSKVNSRAGNPPAAPEQGQEVPHPVLLTALPGRHLPMAKQGNSSP